MPTDLVYHYRKIGSGFSMEQVFADVRGALSHGFQQRESYCPHRRASIGAMWQNCRHARRHVGEVNHITGEVHYLALALPKRGLVLTIHDTGDTNAFHGWKQRVFRYLWYTGPIRRAAAVTFISEYSKEKTSEIIEEPMPNAWVIPDPVSTRFEFSPKVFPASRPRILCLGTKPNKNYERLAEALHGLDVELRIIGRLSAKQLQAIEKADVVFSVVENLSADEILEEYRMADIVSLVSTYEGFGLPIVEGQAAGRPVITSNVCSMPEVAGGAAVLVDPYDPASIRAGFEKILNEADLRAKLISQGRENAKRFHPEAIARQYEGVYASVR